MIDWDEASINSDEEFVRLWWLQVRGMQRGEDAGLGKVSRGLGLWQAL